MLSRNTVWACAMANGDQISMHKVGHIHFVGIGGAGMSGIAELLCTLGYQISGSDLVANRMTSHLQDLGVRVVSGHAAEHVHGADVVVYSSAISADNVELIAARDARIPSIPRAEMLAELMRFRSGIAIAGTHGKTTTTSLVASVLAGGGLDPTFVIGGLLQSASSHARLGSGTYLVAEADESDASFLMLSPLIAVLTNIDHDHLSTYGGEFEQLKASFVAFFRRLPFYGVAVVCIDDDNVRAIAGEFRTRVLTYGASLDADFHLHDLRIDGAQTHFQVTRRGVLNTLELALNMPGRHNALNAVAAVAVGQELGISDAAIQQTLASFAGVGRRCQVRGDYRLDTARTVLVVDDYGHHPREIEAVVRTARESWPARRLVVAFQPHRYSRTRDLFEDFVAVLSDVDLLLLLDVYPAGEEPISSADGRALARAIRLRGDVDPIFVAAPEQTLDLCAKLLEDGDLLLFLGAGSIGRIPESMTFSKSRSSGTADAGGDDLGARCA